jgi:hypothetical protein
MAAEFPAIENESTNNDTMNKVDILLINRIVRILKHLHDTARMLFRRENAVAGQTNLILASGGVNEYGLSNDNIVEQ